MPNPGRLLLPPDCLPLDGPLVFLAGPIQGAPDWQSDAVRRIGELAPGLDVANPRRGYPPGAFDYPAQVDWETHHLRHAGAYGVILFWLAAEAVPVPGRAYAQTSRFELAEWKVRHERDGARLVVGIEPGFSGVRYVRRRFGQDCPGVPVCDTLAAACEKAVELIPTRR